MSNDVSRMNVLSVFDGMSCAQIALKKLGIDCTYYASEIDPYAIKITQKNFPNTIQLGSVCDVTADSLPPIDLLIGGSPCQGFSVAGRRLDFFDPRSKLFWEFVRLIKEVKPKWFLLENVKMKADCQSVISEALGVQPVEINSSLVSAQNRKRLYWTNIPFEGLPTDENKKLSEILESGVVTDRDKSFCLDANFYKGGNLKSYFEKHRRQLVFSADGLAQIGIDCSGIKGHDSLKRIYSASGKSPTLNQCNGGNREPKVAIDEVNKLWRKLSPLECERLQTVPDNYTDGVSNTQRYRMLGNGFTVDVIRHLLKNIPTEKGE